MSFPSPSGEGRGASPALRRFKAIPALRALAIQVACVPPTLAITYLAARLGATPGYAHVALLQGILAALLTVRAGLARWWRLIQMAFPVLLLAALQLDLPPSLFLGAFALFLILFWSTFRTQVPYYPSAPRLRPVVAGLVAETGAPRVIDIGSGFGGLVLDLARRRPNATVEGIELAPLPWLASYLRAMLSGSRARFRRGDYAALDFGQYDLVFAYLSPAAMDALWRKARREMRPGSLLASYEFGIDGAPADRTVVPPGSTRPLYIWQM
ncbi:MAG: SAM-dependent methyltransferase [Telluria sp.]